MKIETNAPLLKPAEVVLKDTAKFWDKTSTIWKEIWGPHIHHGYYDQLDMTPLAACQKLLDKLAEQLNLLPEQSILDVGCGMGETAIYFAKKYPLQITGINISQKQLAMAQDQANKAQAKITFLQDDAHQLKNFSDSTFDIVWSIESCEQYANKPLFVKQAHRVLKPGGKLLIATWCSDQESYQDEDAKRYIDLCNTFCLPYMPTLNFYRHLLSEQFQLIHTADWSEYVKPCWDIGVAKLKEYSFWHLFKLSGIYGIPLIFKVDRLREAFQSGKIRYGVFVASKK